MNPTNSNIEQEIPTFYFGSKELAEFKAQYMKEVAIKFNSNNMHNFANPVLQKGKKTIWTHSNVKYIVDHGNFKTLETSIWGQQLTHSVAL